MKRLLTYILLVAVVLAAGCKSGKGVADKSSGQKHERKPAVTVSPVTLETDGMLIEAKMAQETGNNEKAMELYRSILVRNPRYAVAYYEMGSILEGMGKNDSSLTMIKKAVELDGGNEWYRIALATMYRATGQHRMAVKEWETLVKQKPDKLEYYYELSNSNIAAGDYERAVEALDRVEKRVGVTEEISLQKSKIWTALGKQDKAMAEIEKLANAMPQEKKYNELIAETYMKQKNYAKAKIYYDRIAAAYPDDEYIHISLANLYHQTGNSEETYKELKKGFAQESLDCTSKVQILSSIYTLQELYANPPGHAFELLEEIMEVCEDSTTYAPLYGEILMNQNRYGEAAKQLRSYLKSDSSKYEVWEALLVCEVMDSNSRPYLMSHARRAQELFPFQILPYFVEGQQLVIDKKYDEGQEKLLKCVKLGFRNGYLESDTYSMLAETYYRQDRKEEAWQCFEKSLKASPKDIHVMNNYAYYLSESGAQLEKAEAMSRTTIEAEPENATFLDTYAWVLYKMGRYEEAVKYAEKAVKYDKDNSKTLTEHLDEIRKKLERR